LQCGKTASLFAITNSGYPLCRWQAIAKSRQLVEQRLSLFQVERVEAFGEPLTPVVSSLDRQHY